ncbi:uncharacterized protein PHALS_15129 [Plasmopara halstedii]|uniref:Uncharacterized protein n=1 Tax=Plasmopara halstedii TaxID=4781 RepID=A0A0P1B6P4_PLAHL|nr:uncharacterized protein PHALS_15129 [Plasmopara halstedii]CEG50513.1 hypothetical protein PHALS_15129 [Plasmopara halstedii]|eukprot:XP_024586882.1 hypothetical protein PHALS_15129 [Plasmopara halstedii]
MPRLLNTNFFSGGSSCYIKTEEKSTKQLQIDIFPLPGCCISDFDLVSHPMSEMCTLTSYNMQQTLMFSHRCLYPTAVQ